MKDTLLHACVVVETSNLVISHRCYAEDRKHTCKIRAAHLARLFMLFLLCFRSRNRRHFFNFLISHQCDPGLIPRLGVKCGLRLFLKKQPVT